MIDSRQLRRQNVPNLQTGYLHRGLTHDSLKTTVNKIVKKLKTNNIHHTFDAIAFRGISGALFAPLLAAKLDKNLFAIRKPDVRAHSYRSVEGDYDSKRYVIIDDLICSGETIRAIMETMKDQVKDSQCVGIILYGEGGFEHIVKNGYRQKMVDKWGCWMTDPDTKYFINPKGS